MAEIGSAKGSMSHENQLAAPALCNPQVHARKRLLQLGISVEQKPPPNRRQRDKPTERKQAALRK